MRRPLLLGFIAIALSACGDDPAPAPETTNKVQSESSQGCIKTDAAKGVLLKQTLTAAREKRTYDLVVPESYDPKKPLPLVVVFHGSGGDGAGIRAQLNLEAETGGRAILVYPDALNDGRWDIERASDSNVDYAFFDQIVESVFASHCIDVKRVFATGFSQGGFFANQLACRRGAKLKAIAPIAGGGPFGDATDYDDKGNLRCQEKPVAALVIHGVDDPQVKIEEGQKSRDHWRRVNSCRTTGPGDAYDPSPCVKYAGCASDRPVVYCEVPGIGHSLWAGNGARTVWRFFDAF